MAARRAVVRVRPLRRVADGRRHRGHRQDRAGRALGTPGPRALPGRPAPRQPARLRPRPAARRTGEARELPLRRQTPGHAVSHRTRTVAGCRTDQSPRPPQPFRPPRPPPRRLVPDIRGGRRPAAGCERGVGRRRGGVVRPMSRCRPAAAAARLRVPHSAPAVDAAGGRQPMRGGGLDRALSGRCPSCRTGGPGGCQMSSGRRAVSWGRSSRRRRPSAYC